MSADLPLTPEDVAEIVAILEGSAYESLEVRTTRFTLRVAREGGARNVTTGLFAERVVQGGDHRCVRRRQ